MQIRRRVLDAWLHDLRVGWGERAARSAAAITPVIADGHIGDLHAIGYHFATDGHPLNDVLAWFRLLATITAISPPSGRGGIIQLASGWADGLLHEDAAQSVTPFEVLRLRLRQQVQHVTSRSAPRRAPGARRHRDRRLGGIHSPVSPTMLATAFRTGETMAATPSGKLLILIRRDQDVHERTRSSPPPSRTDTHSSARPFGCGSSRWPCRPTMSIPTFSAWRAEGLSRRPSARLLHSPRAPPTFPSSCGAAVVLSLLLMAACSDSGGGGTDTVDTVAATSTTLHPDDGALVIGAILPRSGGAADLGSSMSDALAVGVAEINAAGGSMAGRFG